MGLRGVHRGGTLLLSTVMVLIGVALLVEAVVGVGGVTVRLIAGVLFVAAGVGRIYIETRRGGLGGGPPADAGSKGGEPLDEVGAARGRRGRRTHG